MPDASQEQLDAFNAAIAGGNYQQAYDMATQAGFGANDIAAYVNQTSNAGGQFGNLTGDYLQSQFGGGAPQTAEQFAALPSYASSGNDYAAPPPVQPSVSLPAVQNTWEPPPAQPSAPVPQTAAQAASTPAWNATTAGAGGLPPNVTQGGLSKFQGLINAGNFQDAYNMGTAAGYNPNDLASYVNQNWGGQFGNLTGDYLTQMYGAGKGPNGPDYSKLGPYNPADPYNPNNRGPNSQYASGWGGYQPAGSAFAGDNPMPESYRQRIQPMIQNEQAVVNAYFNEQLKQAQRNGYSTDSLMNNWNGYLSGKLDPQIKGSILSSANNYFQNALPGWNGYVTNDYGLTTIPRGAEQLTVGGKYNTSAPTFPKAFDANQSHDSLFMPNTLYDYINAYGGWAPGSPNYADPKNRTAALNARLTEAQIKEFQDNPSAAIAKYGAGVKGAAQPGVNYAPSTYNAASASPSNYAPASQTAVNQALGQSLGTTNPSIVNMARTMYGIQGGSPSTADYAPPANTQFQQVSAPANQLGAFDTSNAHGINTGIQQLNTQGTQNRWVNQYIPTINRFIQQHPNATWQDIYNFADSMGVPGLARRLSQLAQGPTPDRRSLVAPYLNYGFGPEQYHYDNVNPLTQLIGGRAYASGGKVAGALGAAPTNVGALNLVRGGAGGQEDNVPARLSPGEYVMDADVVSALGDGNNAAGAKKLDQMRQSVRSHKRSAPASSIPPKAKAPEQYLKGK